MAARRAMWLRSSPSNSSEPILPIAVRNKGTDYQWTIPDGRIRLRIPWNDLLCEPVRCGPASPSMSALRTKCTNASITSTAAKGPYSTCCALLVRLSVKVTSPDRAAAVGRGQVRTPPAAAHRHQQLDCVLVALSFCSHIAKKRPLILALRVQQSENSGAAPAIVDALQANGL